MNGKSPIALYIHIPFCSKKCHYCSFYTIPYTTESADLYCSMVIQEGVQKLSSIHDQYYVETLFLGGGTPSLLSPHAIQEIISALAPQAKEITLEANPENLSDSYLRELAHTPVNRISIGVQTFHDPILKALGRTHSSSSAISAIHRCSHHQFTNLSIDLIYGLPTQSMIDFISDLHQAMVLPITHISLYNLTIDPHTSFYKHKKSVQSSIANQDTLAAMSLFAEDFLSSHGFMRYELASYAKEQAHSLHNLYYWTDRPFLGVGVSASEYLHSSRSKNHSRISHYLRAVRKGLPPQEFSERLEEKERIKEALALRLRLTVGAKWMDFPPALMNALSALPQTEDLLDENDTFLFLNQKGRLFHDTVAEEIMALTF